MAAKVYERSKSSKLSLDDTTPLVCVIECGEKIQDHVEYTLKIQRGNTSDLCWQLQKRYTDFVALDGELRVANLDLRLPPKKMIGNFGREFVAERQLGLQNYLSALLSQPVLYNGLPVKRFLDPDNYQTNFTETALQHVSMVLRSEKKWDVLEPLPDIGWRIRKEYILVKPFDQPKLRLMLSWCEFGPDRYLPDKELEALLKVLQQLQHPYIQTPILLTSNENGGLAIRPCFDKGTLKDFICRCKPRGHYLKKYSCPTKSFGLDVSTVKLIGRQILETLNLLHEKGFPYGHLHTGNIVFDGKSCKLLELENWLLGLPSYRRQNILQYKKIQTTELMDVYCFGHLLYEMTFGRELREETCDNFPPTCPAQLRSVLECILTTEACRNGLPSVPDLLMHPFFADVPLPACDKPVLKIPSKLKGALRDAKEEFENRLKAEQKAIYKKKRVSKAKSYHMSEEEKSKRRRSKKKDLENGEDGKKNSEPLKRGTSEQSETTGSENSGATPTSDPKEACKQTP